MVFCDGRPGREGRSQPAAAFPESLSGSGSRDYSVLPNYCRAFDVCMMPFAINAATRIHQSDQGAGISGDRPPGHLTPVKDVVRQYSDLVDIVETPEEFVAAAERALKDRRLERIQRGIEKARNSSWESTVANAGPVKSAISPNDRRSARKITLLAQSELNTSFRRRKDHDATEKCLRSCGRASRNGPGNGSYRRGAGFCL